MEAPLLLVVRLVVIWGEQMQVPGGGARAHIVPTAEWTVKAIPRQLLVGMYSRLFYTRGSTDRGAISRTREIVAMLMRGYGLCRHKDIWRSRSL